MNTAFHSVVEILSPSSARHDRFTKRRRYQRTGVSEYWVVDLDARAVERWRPGDARPEVLDEVLIWNSPSCGATALHTPGRAVRRGARPPGHLPEPSGPFLPLPFRTAELPLDLAEAS